MGKPAFQSFGPFGKNNTDFPGMKPQNLLFQYIDIFIGA